MAILAAGDSAVLIGMTKCAVKFCVSQVPLLKLFILVVVTTSALLIGNVIAVQLFAHIVNWMALHASFAAFKC